MRELSRGSGFDYYKKYLILLTTVFLDMCTRRLLWKTAAGRKAIQARALEWRGDPFIYKTLTPVRDSAYERPDWKYN